MYIIRTKADHKVLHINPAPLSQKLQGTEVYHLFDPATMEIGKTERPLPEHFNIDETGEILELSLQEKIQKGIVTLAPGEKVEGNRIVSMTLREKLSAGLLTLEPGQKIVGEDEKERIVPMTPDEMADAGLIPQEQHIETAVRRLRAETAMLMESRKTSQGYAIDQLARQKVAFTYPFRNRPDTDPEKDALLKKRLIYPDAIVDEILCELEKLQAAYDAARNAVTDAIEKGKPAAESSAITIAQFLPKQ